MFVRPPSISLDANLVPLAGIEPALLAESDFESDASTSSAIGARDKAAGADIERVMAQGQCVRGGHSPAWTAAPQGRKSCCTAKDLHVQFALPPNPIARRRSACGARAGRGRLRGELVLSHAARRSAGPDGARQS